MNLINSNPNPTSISQIFTNRKARILNLVFCFLILGCGGLETNSFQFCDNFNEPLDCTEPKTEKDVIYLDQKLFKKVNPSFEDFGNFLYFTARETPGFRLVLSKPYNGLGKETFRSGYVAYLKYGNSSERMEGNLFQNSIVVSFHYLGALLKEEFRHKGIEKSPFRLEDLGPISLEYKVMVPGMEPITKQRVVELRWK
ncbi:hypothetical protein ND861_05835 [Leptospira sp. 2 VSF19]|uniref:Lipoprotein n=1 Tax=Leptospira soteropolitanensis TaxID=2950025 RepID=A0AAW5VG00_9LEPT|nr:hypothetical protein [Leptospira soteropolitanensis]MCW7492175.1 hypothetical protein [Leptospira soteropolitanensis]MCW7499757.1 hypothetical protein [Leptospira soteropolitanensis]MCW7522008.1 hypothetical protein [Leptospira soteropolitanensis]MCW7525862.1 hypothetical protein [Leptospira soteropolitanensis]MCW7530024.1 hypothetical protein [Leptospira soteropolitanensis]